MKLSFPLFARSVPVLLALSCLTAQARDMPAPCSEDPIFAQQDFTVGQWDVYADGKKIAAVRMEKTLKGCAIHETWTPVDGQPGNVLGLFTYSRSLKSWGYVWVGDTGATVASTGSLQSPGNIRYVHEEPLPNGGKRRHHWSLMLQPDGAVRELAESTTDGKNWSTDYDLLWRKKI